VVQWVAATRQRLVRDRSEHRMGSQCSTVLDSADEDKQESGTFRLSAQR
jgi:hypothetical protein